MTGIIRKAEKFPMAKVPGAQCLDDVFKGWEKKGLEPIEVTEKDFEQTISIKHNAFNGRFNWKADGLDGIQALGLMADVMRDMFLYFIGNSGRPRLNSGKAKIAVMLDDNNVALAFDKKEDPTVVKGLLMAALWKLIEKTNSGDYNPFDELAGLLNFKIDQQ